jgi:predicted RNA methylase
MGRTVAKAGAGGDLAWLGEAHEETLRRDPELRRRRGAFMTPPELAQRVAEAALAPWLRDRRGVPSVLDPACGTGNLLVAAAKTLLAKGRQPLAVARSLRGVEIDRETAEVARTRLASLLGGGPAIERVVRANIRVADATAVTPRWLQADAVVANPPFLGQLKKGTTIDRATASRWRKRFGEAVGGYADPAAAFLLLIARSLRAGGRACVVLPRSMLAVASAEPVRRAVSELAELAGVWMDDRFVFDAGTRVAALTLVRRSGGQGQTPLGMEGQVTTALPWAVWRGRWSAAAAAGAGVPALEPVHAGVVGDLASATADFRDQFYGMRGTLCDDRHAGRGLNALRPRTAAIDRGASRMDRLPVLTTGLIGWNCSHWGERPARLLGRSFQHPAARVPALLSRPVMRGWLSDALHPKILVATQTPVIEAVVDPFGELAPGVPVIRLLPHDAAELWLLAAAVLSPACSAVAWWRHAGAGLSPKAIKLSARQVLELPLPVGVVAWKRSAEWLQRFRLAADDRGRMQAMSAFAEASADAYTVPADRREALARWWQPLAWGTFRR